MKIEYTLNPNKRNKEVLNVAILISDTKNIFRWWATPLTTNETSRKTEKESNQDSLFLFKPRFGQTLIGFSSFIEYNFNCIFSR